MNFDYYLLLLLIPIGILFVYVEFGKKDLNRIKNKEVGDGQFGSARWITEKEKDKAYKRILYNPELWRKDKKSREELKNKQGIVFGFKRNFFRNIALVDTSDSNTLMVGPAGIGKTNFFLIPQIEYAGASGMSFLVTDTKGYIYQKMAPILEKYYGYNIVLIDFRSPLKSESFNLMTLVNKYMDASKKNKNSEQGLIFEAKAQKYAKICAKSIIESAGFKGGGDNSYFYDSAEGLITSSILLVSEYGEKDNRHIISVFKMIQELSSNIGDSTNKQDLKTEFSKLIALLPSDHKSKWFAGATIEADYKTSLSVFSTALSRLTKFIDAELEQILCFDGKFNAEDFANNKTAIFVVLPEEDKTKYFLFSLFLMQLYRELLALADEKGGAFPNRILFFEDEFGTLPPITDVEMVFSASRSRNILSVPIIQSFGQLKKNYGEEGKEIILDNCQNVIFSGFSPTSRTAEELSKAIGNYTTQTASVNNNFKEKKSINIQMSSRALMTPDEIKRIEKGKFIVLKTGCFPMMINVPLFLKWGIKFEDDMLSEINKIKQVKYVSIDKLKRKIMGIDVSLEKE